MRIILLSLIVFFAVTLLAAETLTPASGKTRNSLSESSTMSSQTTTRVDFGSLLTSINTDSISWFLQQMQDFGTRYTCADNRLAVANWLRDQFLRFGITDTKQSISFNRIYPNPFRNRLSISLSRVKKNSPLHLAIYNIKGQEVRSLYDAIAKTTDLSLTWDAKDASGHPATNSIYLINAWQEGISACRKVIKLD